ncbi:uncharacterized protein PV09_04309 [Verruconis gallopava]|uniref:Uncharacterized protein n=1 Tax=Verruconis gallopava TaxID=253628 RepID=A0A0D1YV82_9PEZI|nr:uncharacterized protein PV09_04309 [Verruconis gallopava]KIW04557.1 hypothetical protein PV09_04309 [Verruconis gallopava]
MKGIVIISAIARISYAWVDPKPSVTDAVAMKELGLARGFSPKPTTAPMHRDLLRRQGSTQILGYLAPDNTCGYVDGIIGAVKTCDPTENCAAVLGTDSFYTMGCCGTGQCTMYGACYDYASMSACDHTCQQDINIVKCASAAYPYCYGYSVPGMSMGFYSCDSVSASTFDVFETTFSGETNAKTWTALRESDFSSLLASDVSSVTGSGLRSGGITLTNSVPSSSSTVSSSSSSTATQIISNDKKSTPVGAIVGGVVGGIAVLGAIIGAVVFFLLKNKKNKPAPVAPAAPGNDPHMSQYGAPNTTPGGPGYYQAPGAGNTASGYFAPATAKMDGSDTKYGGQSTIIESNVPALTPASPAPAYSAPGEQGVQQPQMLPSPAGSPPPQTDPRFSAVSQAPSAYVPPGYQAPPQHTYAQQPAAPVELGSTYAIPTQHQGRPVYEAE